MPKLKKVKKDKKTYLKVVFDRPTDTHSVEVHGLNGMELLIAYQSLQNAIESKMEMPINIALKLMSDIEEKGKQKKEEAKEKKDYFAKRK